MYNCQLSIVNCTLFLKQSSLRRFGRDPAEVAVGRGGRDASPRGAVQEAVLDQERLIDVLNGVALLADRRGNRVEPHRSPSELVDDGKQYHPVHRVESHLVYLKKLQRLVRNRTCYHAARSHLREVAH